jgi:uncharacterized protein (DUF1697 family)
VAATHVALLRGVNVGGARPLPMAGLREALAADGLEAVETYVQSGNVALRDPGAAGTAVAARIRAVIAAAFGMDVPVVVRSAAEMAAVVDANPFAGIAGAAGSTLHVAFLERLPAPELVAALDPDRSPPDRLAVVGSEVFAHCPNGLGRSKVFVGLEKALGTPATVRNWNTVTRLFAMCD